MTKIINISEVEDYSDEIIATFKEGGVILYPTDTQYGLGVLAKKKELVERVNKIKKARLDKPVSVIVSDITMAERYVYINDEARKLMCKYLPAALTLILPAKDRVLADSVGGQDAIGIRIPDHDGILEIVRKLDEPIITTSANVSGKEPAKNYADILASLEGIDLAIDGGSLDNAASTIVKFSVTEPRFKIVRQGALKI